MKEKLYGSYQKAVVQESSDGNSLLYQISHEFNFLLVPSTNVDWPLRLQVFPLSLSSSFVTVNDA